MKLYAINAHFDYSCQFSSTEDEMVENHTIVKT